LCQFLLKGENRKISFNKCCYKTIIAEIFVCRFHGNKDKGLYL
jgi:hypothetical protein